MKKEDLNRYCVSWTERHENCCVKATSPLRAIRTMKAGFFEWDKESLGNMWDWKAKRVKG